MTEFLRAILGAGGQTVTTVDSVEPAVPVIALVSIAISRALILVLDLRQAWLMGVTALMA